MQILIVIILTLFNFLFGLSLLSMLKPQAVKKLGFEEILLSLILGYGISSTLVFVVEFVQLPISKLVLWTAFAFVAIILGFIQFKRNTTIAFIKPKLNLFDVIPILLILCFGGISLWRTIYYPPYSYDSMMGIDLIAKYAVSDQHIAKSELFQEIVPREGIYSNQLFYAPFTMLNQVLYRVLGVSFGQVWLGLFSTIFWLYVYQVLKQFAHPVFAIIFTLFLIVAPEVYAYSFILQTDWSNAIFFFVGVFYFYRFTRTDNKGDFYLSLAGMYFACWTRTETLFFLPFGSLVLLIRSYIQDRKFALNKLLNPILFTAVPTISVIVWNFIYVELFLPSGVDLTGQIQPSISALFSEWGTTIESINKAVVFRTAYWGYTIKVFISILLISIPVAIIRKKKFTGLEIVFWIFIIYFVYSILVIQFPSVTIQNTVRRGFFKIIPLLSLFMVMSPMMQWVNDFFVNNTKPVKRKK